MADWIVGKDKGGKVYLFQQGATDPSGKPASTKGLTQWVDLGGNIFTAGSKLQDALGKLGANAVQVSAVTQAVDAGPIALKGSTYEAFPVGQKAGTTQPGQGQAPSGSEAVPAGINLPGLPSLSGIEQFIIRVLEGLVGIALIALGLQALTGGTGNPVDAVKSGAAKAAMVAR